jgi:hypothetical protein
MTKNRMILSILDSSLVPLTTTPQKKSPAEKAAADVDDVIEGVVGEAGDAFRKAD